MSYPYDQIFAGDPSAPERVAVNGIVTIFTPGDATMAPLTITTLDGLPLANPVQVNESGFGPAFQHETLDQVAWAGGGFSGLMVSYKGLKDEAVSARLAAQEAAASAQAPTAESIDQGIARADIPKTVAAAVAAAPAVTAAAAAAVDANPKIAELQTSTTRHQGSITTLDERSFAQGRSITTLDQRSIAQGERVNAIETVAIPGALNAATTYADGELGKDRTRLAGLETIAVPKALADAKTYADAEVTKDRIRLTQAEAADVKQNADIRETLRAALAYADGKAADINRVLDTSHIALDADGTPYYRPGSTTVKVQQDTDGTPYYETA